MSDVAVHDSTPRAPGSSGHMILPSAAPTVRFQFEERQQRLGGALGFSLISHIGIAALLIFLATRLPEETKTQLVDTLKNYDIVWLPIPGPGGGGGGGGNRIPEPPRKAELPGKEKITVPV